MVGRIVRSADFQRALAVAPRSRSAHFAAHHLAASPSLPCKASKKPVPTELSTGDAPSCPLPVDESLAAVPETAPAGRWLGLVVPKRHARRSVTRSLLKRQMRAVMRCHAQALPPGLWVLRLKAPFDRQQFGSAASAPLQQAAGDELQLLLQRAADPRPPRPGPRR